MPYHIVLYFYSAGLYFSMHCWLYSLQCMRRVDCRILGIHRSMVLCAMLILYCWFWYWWWMECMSYLWNWGDSLRWWDRLGFGDAGFAFDFIGWLLGDVVAGLARRQYAGGVDYFDIAWGQLYTADQGRRLGCGYSDYLAAGSGGKRL